MLADSDRELTGFADAMAALGYRASWERVDEERSCQALLDANEWDLVVCWFTAGRPPNALRALRDWLEAADPRTPVAPLMIVADSFDEVAEAAQRLGASVCLREHGLQHLAPALENVVRRGRGRRTRARWAAFEAGQRTILEHISAGRPLPDVLEEIVLLIEQQGDGMLCSILLLDAEGRRVRHGAAPNLPRALIEGVDGSEIGPREGSCGAAAYLRELVIIEDIGTHPNWTGYRHLVLPFGLRACWSSPIVPAPGGDVLGTFAMYYREARSPRPLEREWVAAATHLAAVAIQRDRAERAIRETDARYRQIVETAYEGIWVIDADARTLFTNDRTAKLLGYDPTELRGRRMVDFMDETSRRYAEGSFIERLRTFNQQHEVRFQRKDGTRFWALISGSPIRGEQGQSVGALAMITDISELKHTEEALRRSEAEFRVVFERAAIGMALLDAQGKVARSNPALQQFLAYTELELRWLSFADLAHPDDRGRELEFHRDLLERQLDAYRGEQRYRRKNGDIVWGRLTASLVQPSQHLPQSVIVMVEDVTVRRQLEEAVRASERLRTLMYTAVTDVLFYLEVTAEGAFRFLSVNPAFTRATGLSEVEVIGRAVTDVIPEPSCSTVLAQYRRAIRERRTIRWDEVTPYPAGKRYGEVTITPIFDGSGTCTNLVGTVHDITERRLAEQRVEAQAALLDKARDAIIVRSVEGRIEYWNHGAERVYGWSRSEALGSNVLDLIYPDRADFDRAQQRLLDSGHWSGELVHYDKARRRRVLDCSWTLIRDEQQRPSSVLNINSDITEKKSLEAQVFHTQRLESLGLLVGGVAHDFNNLLTAILANAEVADELLQQLPAARETVAEMAQAGQRGVDLARRLLSFSRRDDARRRPAQLVPLVVEALGLLRMTLPKTVRVDTHFAADVPEILADPTQIHQIVMNLATNAAQAMGERGGTLSVSAQRVLLERDLPVRAAVLHPGEYARLVVTDTGPGMDEATLQRIFEPFFTIKPPGEGTGLGLSVVHGIVRNHEGGITVRSRPGEGAEFSIYFPAASNAPASAHGHDE
ncbi:MAG TPA: PAS domain S-box protein [Polyangiaceae bacterium]|nr:PAS domain S-box protein [Polyangiaceae bacterium]